MSFHVGQKVARKAGTKNYFCVRVPEVDEPCTVANVYAAPDGEEMIELNRISDSRDMCHICRLQSAPFPPHHRTQVRHLHLHSLTDTEREREGGGMSHFHGGLFGMFVGFVVAFIVTVPFDIAHATFSQVIVLVVAATSITAHVIDLIIAALTRAARTSAS